jgi:hypothetical protein
MQQWEEARFEGPDIAGQMDGWLDVVLEDIRLD